MLKGYKPFTISAKRTILDVRQNFENASEDSEAVVQMGSVKNAVFN